jgi:hypothetical protein
MGLRGFLWVWIMGSRNVMGSGYGSDTSVVMTRFHMYNPTSSHKIYSELFLSSLGTLIYNTFGTEIPIVQCQFHLHNAKVHFIANACHPIQYFLGSVLHFFFQVCRDRKILILSSWLF